MNIILQIFSRIKKIKISLFATILLVLLLGFAGTAQAQSKVTYTLGDFIKGLASTGQNKQSFDFQSFTGLAASLYATLAGCKNIPGCPEPLQAGAVQYANEAIAGVYTVPPASGVYYALETARDLNLVRPAYAQDGGFGFKALDPFLNIWKAVRNIVYVLFVIFIVVLGFMVMFRQRISPQAVMTVQAALPRMIVALIMITFSYAIVGFLIDLMYVFFGILVFGIGASGGLSNYNSSTYFNNFSTSGFDTTAWHVISRGLGASGDVFAGLFTSNLTIPAVGGALIAALVTVAATVIGAGTAIGVAALPLLLGLIVTFIGFLIRILLALARAYLLLLIHLIFAPFFILWSAFTGVGVYQGWLKGVLSNLSVFFAVGVLIFLADVLINQVNAVDSVWGPPYLGGNRKVITGMIGFGSIVLISQMPEFVNQLFNIRGFQFQMPSLGRQVESFTGTAGQITGRSVSERISEGVSVFRNPFRRT